MLLRSRYKAVGMLVAKPRSMFRSCADAVMQCHVCEAVATVAKLSETVAKSFNAAQTMSTMQCDTYKSLASGSWLCQV